MGRRRIDIFKTRLKRLLLLGLLVLIVVMTIKTIRFSSKQISIDPVKHVELDPAISTRLSEAVQIKTISYEDHIDTLEFEKFKTFIDSNYLLCNQLLEREVHNEYSFIYKWKGSNSDLNPVLFIAHIDVVPVEPASLVQWEEDPFGGAIKDGFIWGRGTLDDKLSVLGLLEASEWLLKNGYKPARSIYMAFGHDEEVSGINGAQSIAAQFKREGLQFEYVLDEGMAIVDGAMPGINQPVAYVGLNEKGYATFELVANIGEGGHSSMPPRETAIGVLAESIRKLEKNQMPGSFADPIISMFEYVGPEMQPHFKVIFANRWLFNGLLKKIFSAKYTTNSLLRTTTAVTMAEAGIKENVLPVEAKATVNFRILPEETIEDVIAHVTKVINDDRVTINVSPASSNPPENSQIDAFGFKVLHQTIREVFPEVIVAPSMMMATSDCRHYEEVGLNNYRFLPMLLTENDVSRIHGTNERIKVEDYKNVVQFYYWLLQRSSL